MGHLLTLLETATTAGTMATQLMIILISLPLLPHVGNSINFADGDHAVVVDTGGDQDVFNLKTITVSLWVKGLTGNNATMISKEGNNDRGWAIRRNGTTKNIESRWCIAGNDHTATGDILDDGEWHHVAASWMGAFAHFT